MILSCLNWLPFQRKLFTTKCAKSSIFLVHDQTDLVKSLEIHIVCKRLKGHAFGGLSSCGWLSFWISESSTCYASGTFALVSSKNAGASIPPRQWCIPPCFRFPPISEKFLKLVENIPSFIFSERFFRFSSAKISDDLFVSHRLHILEIHPYFSCFITFPPYFG